MYVGGRQTHLKLSLGHVTGHSFSQEVTCQSHGVEGVVSLANQFRDVRDLLDEAGHRSVEVCFGRTS